MIKYFIGIDGGGSETRAVVVSDALEIIGRGAAGPGNHYLTGPAQAARNCGAAAEAALEDAMRVEPGLGRGTLQGWGFGLAGVRRPGDTAIMRDALAHLPGSLPWVLDNDAAAAQAGAFAGGSGILLSAGTGAIALGINDYQERFYADGWGALLGDEGSGYWMGVEALRAVCRDSDGRGPRTRLSLPVLQALKLANCDDLVQFIYSPQCTPDQIAALARVVLEMAETGAEVAVQIRERAVGYLGLSVVAVARQMLNRLQSLSAQPAPVDLAVALWGGVLEDDYFRAAVGFEIGERMVDLKRDFLPLGSWRVVRPQFDAAVGAAILVQKKT